MASGQGKRVCVTGASGYIATWLTKLLLQRGYAVRATVRNLNDKTKTQHLLALDGANERLHLFEADLFVEGSFDSAIDGCEGVFHTASPCHFDCKDPQAELIDPAVKGTINVLTSCGKSSSVKRVVLTSSMAAMLYNSRPRTPDTVVDETWFSDPQYCRENKHWYMLAKTLAEEAAWKFVKEKGIDMVTINPTMVLGPLLQPTLNATSAVIVNLIHNEANEFPNTRLSCVHVEDVACAHVLAFENPSASGRYAVVESCIHFSEVLRLIRELYPTLQLPHKCVDNGFPDSAPVSTEKAKTLGMDSYIPLKVGLKETIESLKERKFVTI